METTAKIYSLSFQNLRTYGFALLFIVGNLLLPQLCHLAHQSGTTLLPLYFFTLIAAYKFGIRVGLLTAILSPLVNSLCFGMPVVAMLPVILVKSTLLAGCAAYAAHRLQRVSVIALVAVVATYQLCGTLFEGVWNGSFSSALSSLRMGLPGMLLQVVAGFLVLKLIAKR